MAPRTRWPHALFALHCAATLFCVGGPGYAWWGSPARPLVLGLPWSFAWVILWLVATFVALVLYWRWHERQAARAE
jgi:hypothetical protein